jgi:hypothetical protein
MAVSADHLPDAPLIAAHSPSGIKLFLRALLTTTVRCVFGYSCAVKV